MSTTIYPNDELKKMLDGSKRHSFYSESVFIPNEKEMEARIDSGEFVKTEMQHFGYRVTFYSLYSAIDEIPKLLKCFHNQYSENAELAIISEFELGLLLGYSVQSSFDFVTHSPRFKTFPVTDILNRHLESISN